MDRNSLPPRNILITGLPGCGKTTLIRSLVHKLWRFGPAGFYTEEMRLLGQRRGFRLVGLNGMEGMLAHADFGTAPRVGKYGVDVPGFENFLRMQKLDQVENRLVFIDEIGKMECLSRNFVDLVRILLDTPKTIVATVALKGGGLIAEVKQRADATVVEVDALNRDRLVVDTTKQIQAAMGR